MWRKWDLAWNAQLVLVLVGTAANDLVTLRLTAYRKFFLCSFS